MGYKGLIICICIFWLVPFSAVGQNIDSLDVTSVSINQSTATIILNHGLEIGNIRVETSKVDFPQEIEILEGSLCQKIDLAIAMGETSILSDKTSIVYRIGDVYSEIKSTTTVDSSTIWKTEVIFNDSLKIGCRVIEKDEGVVVIFPHYVKFLNSYLKKAIEKTIERKINKYLGVK